MFSLKNQSITAITVSELNRYVRDLLEQSFGFMRVTGEISNLSTPSSGHCYFTLKDQQAQIRCAFFRQKRLGSRCRLANGKQMTVTAKVSLYSGRGDYQLLVEQVSDVGAGLLQQQFEELKHKLQRQGLFSEAHKKPLPHYPKKIAIISSEQAAALQDVFTVLARRYPIAEILFYPSAVQGSEAPCQLINAITLANQQQLADVIILTRGGGSLEDLWAFNDEQLAQSIYQSSIPIISAVGHEVDFTIADFVADQRAATPSAAAELVTPDQNNLRQQLDQTQQSLLFTLRRQLQHKQLLLSQLAKRLQHPAERYQQRTDHFLALKQRLFRAAQYRLETKSYQLNAAQQMLAQQSPQHLLKQHQQTLAWQHKLLCQQVQVTLNRQRTQLEKTVELLAALSPLATLKRGYSITYNQAGKAIDSCADLPIGEIITTQMAQGQIQSQIVRIKQ